jgi:glycosyltransferase involved in cell wall biosynthesis
MPAVLLVSPYVTPHIGGVETYVEQVAAQLVARGWRVAIATTGSRHRKRVLPVAETPIPVYEVDAGVRVSNTPVGWRWIADLRRVIEAEQPDLVNAHAPVPALADAAAIAAGALPFVLTYHTGPMRKRSRAVSAFLAGYERLVVTRTAQRSAVVICSSEYVRAHLAGLTPPARLEVVSPAVDVTRFVPPSSDRNRRGVLFAGSLERATTYKRLDLALQAIAALRDRGAPVMLTVVGEGNARRRYERLAESLGVTDLVHFTGALRGPDLVAAYQQARALVLPTDFDSYPTVVAEAMACATPVITTSVGWLPTVVRSGTNGMLVAPGDVPGLVAAISCVIDDPAGAERMGTQARQDAVEQMSATSMGDRVDAIFRRTIEQRPTVALVTPYYAPRTGGVEHYVQELAAHLRDSGRFRPLVVTSSGIGRKESDCVDGIDVVRLPTMLKLSNTPLGVRWPMQLRRVLREECAVLVNTHAPVPGLADAALLAAGRRPVVATYHSGSMKKGVPAIDTWLGLYERMVLPLEWRRAAAVVGVSPSSLVAQRRMDAYIISPGVHTDRFRPRPTDGAVAPRSGTRLPPLVYVGRIERSSSWKGIGVLLDAMAVLARSHPAARLELIGTGDAVPHWRRRVDELGLNDRVEFRGRLEGESLVAAYADALAVVLPSTTEAEAFGMTLIEAMACGVPAVGSRVGGIPYVIDDGITGLLVPPGDALALSAAVARLYDDPTLRVTLGRQARETVVDRNDWKLQLDRYLDLFDELLQSRPGPRH